MWWARLAVKTLRQDQREAIAEAAESRHGPAWIAGLQNGANGVVR